MCQSWARNSILTKFFLTVFSCVAYFCVNLFIIKSTGGLSSGDLPLRSREVQCLWRETAAEIPVGDGPALRVPPPALCSVLWRVSYARAPPSPWGLPSYLIQFQKSPFSFSLQGKDLPPSLRGSPPRLPREPPAQRLFLPSSLPVVVAETAL